MSIEQTSTTPGGVDLLCQARDAVSYFEVLIMTGRASDENAPESIALMSAETDKLCRHYSLGEQPLIGLLVRRLDNFLSDLDGPQKSHFDDFETYVDVLRGILDGEIEQDTDQAEFVRSLPVRVPKDVDGIEFNDMEVLVVDPNRTTARFVERELARRGYRVTITQNSFEALELAIRTHPDMIISAALLDLVDGSDLACMLCAVPVMRGIPFALLTTFDMNHASLQCLPSGVAILRKSDAFAGDLDDALEEFGLTPMPPLATAGGEAA